MRPIKVAEFFSGYGSQSNALEAIGVPFEVVATSEIDVDAIIAYGAMRYDLNEEIDKTDEEIKEFLMSKNIGFDFKKNKSTIKKMKKDKLYKLYNATVLSNNLGDISLIKEIPKCDLFTYSFPCQDISTAGKQKGMIKGTRSGLLLEVERMLCNGFKPTILLMENVKNLVSKKFIPDFQKWCNKLEELGYKNYWKVLNAKDFGVPQNRERIIMISVFGDYTYNFPKEIKLNKMLLSILEKDVDEKYFVNTNKAKELLPKIDERQNIGLIPDRLGGMFDDENGIHQAGSVWNKYGISPTLDTCQGGYRQVCIVSDSQLYKLAGNSIVQQVLEEVFKNMFK